MSFKIIASRTAVALMTILVLPVLVGNAVAQNWQRTPTPNDTLNSVKIHPDNRVTLQIYAPKAADVKLGGGDIPNLGAGAAMTNNDGVWSVTVGPIEPGAYRYNFNIDGVSVVDPKSASISESNGMVWSLFYLPGAAFMDARSVPHGAIAEVTYYSTSLQRFRRMHVYTPPGYESGKGKFPIFYLLHGAFDCDDSWSTVGRAGYILDNLIAEGKAAPMVVVMPAGHTGPFSFGAGRMPMEEFTDDFINDVMPYVESRYRVKAERSQRAVAGLSMGGMHTISIMMQRLDQFAYYGVFSSGVFGMPGGAQQGTSWEEQNRTTLDDANLKEGLKLVWFATGLDDFLLETSRTTVATFKKHGFDVVYSETAGGHTWNNWRDYLHEFAQLLFSNNH